jgi:hypothetical protein
METRCKPPAAALHDFDPSTKAPGGMLFQENETNRHTVTAVMTRAASSTKIS